MSEVVALAPPPTLKIEEVEPPVTAADGTVRLWRFLDYADPRYRHFSDRWFIESRLGDEGLFLRCGFRWTFEGSLERVQQEIALAKEAMEAIRKQAFQGSSE